MARTAAEAIAWGRAQQKRPTQDWHGLCLSFVRQSFGLDYVPASAWPNAKRYAGEAWRRATIKHPTTDASSIPAGVPIFWDSRSDYEHIALSLGGGRCLSTDVPRGKVGEIGIDELTRAWGMTMWGWTEDLIGNRVFGTGAVQTPSAPASKPSIALRVDGVDISHHQAGVIDYGAAKQAGVQWVFHKATEGATYVDPMYARRRSEVQRFGLRFGAYHFARPSSGDAGIEAAHFLDVVKPLPTELLPMLDLEDDGGLNRADLTTWVGRFVRNVERAVGVKPIIYTPFDLDDTFGCLLWVARYNDRNEPPRVPAPWKQWDVRQFSNGQFGVPDQVAGFGHVDLNTMRPGLTVADLTIGAEPEPEPEPTPVPLPEPAPDVPPHDPFGMAIVPGRWDAAVKHWVRRWREARDKSAQITTHTEGTKLELVESFTAELAKQGWQTYHDPMPGPANIIHAWDSVRFEAVGEPWKVKLEDIPALTKTGFVQPDTYSVGRALRDKVTGGVILLVGAHLPLSNTLRRQRAAEMAREALRDHAFDGGREQFPKATRILACDFNLPSRKASVRQWFAETWPGLTAAWSDQRGRRQGPDWIAVGARLSVLDTRVLPRAKDDPLDHTTKISRLGWRS